MGLDNRLLYQELGESTAEMSFFADGGVVSPDGKRYAEDLVERHERHDWELPMVCLETGEHFDYWAQGDEEREKWLRVKKDESREKYFRKAYWLNRWFMDHLDLDWGEDSQFARVPVEVLRAFVRALRECLEMVGDRYIPGPDEWRISDEQAWCVTSGYAYARVAAHFETGSLFSPSRFDAWIARDMRAALEWCEPVLRRYEAGFLEAVWFAQW